uniref:Mitochondrial import inner membrane translocase subunit TIM16 n=1 Tax=Strombidinopsis acuminata TaxID=141414 RepID=A0A7S3S8R3_9SPIT|mmetsp:Transcript_28919/g.78967  ORF Transcript_28919/g.78967 Transcript_28919/m.78967 type:complete len:182 (-) Transcript_28919:377-922(-)
MLRSVSRGLWPARLSAVPRSSAALSPFANDNRLKPFSLQVGAVRHGSGGVGAPIIRLLANLVVMGTGVVGRAFVEAYHQALKNGGVASNAGQRGAARTTAIEAEARQILNVGPKATREEVLEAAERLRTMNDPSKGGSSYLQDKITFARDALAKPESKPETSETGDKNSSKDDNQAEQSKR